ncbi:hypothetical protein ES703_19140 [subsurface metagenome]
MMIYHRDVSPLYHPEAWIQVAMNQALFLVSIEPWVKEGVITILPPLKWFDYDFFEAEIVKGALKRRQSYDEEIHRTLIASMFTDEILKSFRPEHIESVLGLTLGDNLSKEFIEACKELAKSEFQKNPIRYAWDITQEGDGTIVKFGSGTNLESTLFSADLCGAYILFGEKTYRIEYDIAVKKQENKYIDSLTELSRAFAYLDFSFLNAVKLDFVLNLRKEGRLARLRNFLLEVWSKVSSVEFLESENLYKFFKENLEEQYEYYKEEWQDINKTLKRNMARIAISSGIAILSGQLSFIVAGAGLTGFGLLELLKTYDKRARHKKLPLGVFLDLERKKN